ncbi:tetratricopeptide repeat protein [Flavobacteriaceae bacterium MAR_2010_105]|nr:tetratricopeptide repeat protein [Flavobacteriaceae bacterium MAR_2010_105]
MKSLLIISILLFISFNVFSQDSLNSKGPLNSQRTENRINDLKQLEVKFNEAKSIKDLDTQVFTLINIIGSKYDEFGDYLGAYRDALYLENLINEHPNLESAKKVGPRLNMFLGCLLRDQLRLEESIPYFEKSIKLAEQNEDDLFYFWSNLHMAEVLGRIDQKERALRIFRKFEKEAINENDTLKLTRVYEILTWYYYHGEQHDSTLIYAKKSLYDKAPKNQLAHRLSRISESYILLNKEWDSAIFYAQKSLEIADTFELKQQQLLAHSNLSTAYGKLGNYKEAYYHFKKFYELEQAQRSYDNAIQIGQINIKQEQEKALFQEALSNQKISNQRMTIWIALGVLLIFVIGIIYISNRIKFIKHQNKIIEEEKKKVEQSERYKEQFLANMSHEVRTPMHAISGMINTLKRQTHPTDQDPYLEAMKISADNLLVLLNDVLDMSKIESGNLDIVQINMNAIEIVKQVVNIYKNKAEEKGLLLKIDIAEDFPKTIIGDPGRLNQILMNLVSNAIKFTEKGHVKIELSHSQDKIKFAVKDTGMGIPSDQQKAVFESFKQGKNVSKGFYGGTGLGLTITKQLIHLQGGAIWLESEVDKGSIFYFELPLIVGDKTQESQPTLDESELKVLGVELKGLRILIAEDNEFNIMVVKDDLNWYIPDIDISIADNGKLAVEMYQKDTFDLILMDVQMPEMNGYEATSKIREIESSSKKDKTIPIIAMTASLLKDQIDKCYAVGMNAYIPKPYKPDELVSTIFNIVRNTAS